ncbi:MAG: hypothetical protein ACE5G5_06940 [Candidatus Methylomirabilales bacterium]
MQDEYLEIHGDVVRTLRRASDGSALSNREVRLADFLQSLTARLSTGKALPLLPIGARWALLRGQDAVFAIEEPPQERRITWWDGDGSGTEHWLAFPYVIYLVLFHRGSFEEMRLYYRTGPLRTERDELFMANLWNVSAGESPLAHGRVCLRGRPPFEDLTVAGQVQTAIEFFWGTGFNREVEENCFERSRDADPRIASLEAWERASREDPLFPLTVHWHKTGLSLAASAERLLTWRGSQRPIVEGSDLVDLVYRIPEE